MHRTSRRSLAAAASFLLAMRPALGAAFDQKITDWSTPTSGPYQLGTELAVDGTTALIGARDGIKVHRDFGSGWVLNQTLVVATIYDQVPKIALQGDLAVFGAFDEDWDPFDYFHEGAAYVYRRSGGGTWTQEVRLAVGSDSAGFSRSVAIGTDRLLIGTQNQGAYVYGWNGAAWVLEQQLLISSPPTLTGSPVAWAGDRALVGSADGIFVFEHTGPPLTPWLPVQLLVPSGGCPYCGSGGFEPTLDADGDVAVVGVRGDGEAGALAGAVYAFRRVGSSFEEEQKILGAAAGDRFGTAVALHGNALLVTSSGRGAHHRWNGSDWVEVESLLPAPVPQSYGRAAALGTAQAFVSAPDEGPPWSSSSAFGAVYAWDLALCGDGTLDATEQCDDGNLMSGDGCNATCTFEGGCSNGLDDDGDVLVDYPADPGCQNAGGTENPKCQNGLDDDADGKVDFDGGAAANGGVPIAPADPQCTVAWKTKEAAPPCGLGAELVLLAGLTLLRRRA
jgi:cysteine-rich repeat protein